MPTIANLTFTLWSLDEELKRAQKERLKRATTAFNKTVDSGTAKAQQNALGKLDACKEEIYLEQLAVLHTGSIRIEEAVKRRGGSMVATPKGTETIGEPTRLTRSMRWGVNGHTASDMSGTQHLPVSDSTRDSIALLTIEHNGAVIAAYPLNLRRDSNGKLLWSNAVVANDNYSSIAFDGGGARLTVSSDAGTVELTLSPELCKGKSKRRNVRSAAQTFTFNAVVRQTVQQLAPIEQLAAL